LNSMAKQKKPQERTPRAPKGGRKDSRDSSAKKSTHRMKDATALATKARKLIDSLQRGRALRPMSNFTIEATHRALSDSISTVAQSIPRRRQVSAMKSLREIAENIRLSLGSADAPAQWIVSKDYRSIAADNRTLERSLLLNEGHRHELHRQITSTKRQLSEEEQALEAIQHTTLALREQTGPSEVHRLLSMPPKHLSVTSVIRSEQHREAPHKEHSGDQNSDMKILLSKQLSLLDQHSSVGLPLLELIGQTRDQLVAAACCLDDP